MEREVVIPVAERDTPHVAMAIELLTSERGDLRIEARDREVAIKCDDRGDAASAWATALLNERLVATARERRSLLLAELLT